MGAFVGFFLGCCVIAWAVFFVGRRIARVLWALLIVAEKDERQRQIYETQAHMIFGEEISEVSSPDQAVTRPYSQPHGRR